MPLNSLGLGFVLTAKDLVSGVIGASGRASPTSSTVPTI